MVVMGQSPYLSVLGTLAFRPLFYVFGGITKEGETNELWTYSPGENVWTQISPAFAGATWPGPRAFHDIDLFTATATSAMVEQLNVWATNCSSFATTRLSTFAPHLFPASSNAALPPVTAYTQQVVASYARGQRLAPLVKVNARLQLRHFFFFLLNFYFIYIYIYILNV